ncbi:PREDICTED: uncharacterized protein LOC106338784 [Brassica oleracea var. oleracea]|uniref:uncharacterized protein LOC106338784 n=1 Tax=Brassica oleracea var. oleracea TaxID=109376 RepID=UPI0006A6C059|nr:PREDICTED: uncharacterized protein LOC106338784 [Brassica oleracea var. oleracea]
MEPLIETFPWILWYIWKARNDKLFNGREVSPVDTLQLASVETECWRKANLSEDEVEEETRSAPSVTLTLHVAPQRPTCQIDASLIDDGTVSGLGWFFKDPMGVERFGLQGCRKSLSALMQRWKDSYGRCLVYESYIAPRFKWRRIAPTWWT